MSPADALEYLNDNIDLGDFGEFKDTIYGDIKNKAKMQKAGYDGIVSDYGDGIIEKVVFDTNQIKTKSQLLDIYKKAHETTASPLIAEAKKYKSADSFVKAQPTYYHQSQSNTPFDEFKQKGDKGYKKAHYSQANEGIYFSSDKGLVQSKYGKSGGTLLEVAIDSKKKLDLGKYDAMYFDGRMVNSGDSVVENFKRSLQGQEPIPEPDILLTGISKKAKKWLENNGYDAVEGMKGEMWSAPELVVIDKSIIKTKSQLLDIYKKAHGDKLGKLRKK